MGWNPRTTLLKYHQIQNIVILVSAIYAYQPNIDACWGVNCCGMAFLPGDMMGLGKMVSLLGIILWIKVGQEAHYKGHCASRYAFDRRVSVEQGRTLPLAQYTICKYSSQKDSFPAVNNQRQMTILRATHFRRSLHNKSTTASTLLKAKSKSRKVIVLETCSTNCARDAV